MLQRIRLLGFVVAGYLVALGVSPFVALQFGDYETSSLGNSYAPITWFIFGYGSWSHLLLAGGLALIFAASISRWPAYWTLGVFLAVSLTLPRYFIWLLLLDYTSPNESRQAIFATVIVCTAIAAAVFYLLQRFAGARRASAT